MILLFAPAMLKRLSLLVVVMAIPILTALGTQQLAHTTDPPVLPMDPATSQSVSPTAQGEPSDDDDDEPRPGSVAPVVPGSIDENGDVTDPGMASVEGEDLPESGTVDR